MELRDGRGGQLGEEDTLYIVQEQIQPLSTNSARGERYDRTWQAVLPHGTTVLPQGTAVLPLAQQELDQLVARAVEPPERYFDDVLKGSRIVESQCSKGHHFRVNVSILSKPVS